MKTIGDYPWNYDDLMAFHTVAREGGFTAAAKKQNLSKALLSKQVLRLEAQLRVQLFLRTTRSLRMTEAGQELFKTTAQIHDLAQTARVQLRSLASPLEAHARIAMPVSFGEYFAPSFLVQTQKSLPGLQLEIDAANEVVDLFKGNVDFALRVADEHHPDLVAKYLGRMRDVICASPAFIAANRADYGDAREMERLECIQHSMHPEWNVWNLIPRKVSKKLPAAEAIKLRTHGRISCNQYSVIHSLCVAGRGVARMPYYMAEHDIKHGRLVHLFDDYEISTHRLYLVYLKPSYATQRQETLKREILEWFHSRRDVLANSEG